MPGPSCISFIFIHKKSLFFPGTVSTLAFLQVSIVMTTILILSKKRKKFIGADHTLHN